MYVNKVILIVLFLKEGFSERMVERVMCLFGIERVFYIVEDSCNGFFI